MPHVRAGTIKAYAVTAESRLQAAPDIPTVDEALRRRLKGEEHITAHSAGFWRLAKS